MGKRQRQQRILELLRGGALASQERLRRRLALGGVRVTQATLSRDIKELGLVKSAEGYRLPNGNPAARAPAAPPPPPLGHMLREFVSDVKDAQNLLVLRTGPGSAQPVAAALDTQKWGEVVGTVAGDDTILIVTASRKARQRLHHRIQELLG